MNLEFKKQHPTCEGHYLIHWKSGEFEAIRVYYRPKEFAHGVEWEGGFFYGRRHVSRINLDMMHGIAKLFV